MTYRHASRREFLHARRQVDRKLGRKWQAASRLPAKTFEETRSRGTLYRYYQDNKLNAALPNMETPQYRL
jgi:hypothetical protein